MDSLHSFATHMLRTLGTGLRRAPSGLVAFALVAPLISGCGGEDNPYTPQKAWSGKPANLPAPPGMPATPVKQGDAYTVYGAIHQLRSQYHAKDVVAQPITIVGYIVDSNIPRAPECAVHKVGKADPENCSPEAPSFWVGDEKGNAKGQKIRVVGWARNPAVIYDAMKEYRKVKPGEQPKALVKDDQLNVDVPFPLPSVGAKVRVTGSYGLSKMLSSSLVSEPLGGVMAYAKLETLEPASEPAKFSKPIP